MNSAERIDSAYADSHPITAISQFAPPIKGCVIDPYKYRRKWYSIPWNQKKYNKHKYHHPDGKKLAAGGICFFEETTEGKGLWLIEEYDNYGDKKIYTDFGGKYDYNDGDIFATISREFREESYNTVEITYQTIKDTPTDAHVYIDGYDGYPVYMCIVMHINCFGIQFNSDKIKEAREKVVQANPYISEKWYKTRDVKFVLLKDLESGTCQPSNRLAAILNDICEHPEKYNQEIKDFFSNVYISKNK